MALFIDFKSGVDEYYRNQAKDSPWSSILSSLEKGYTKANYDLNKQSQQNNVLAVQSGQKAVTDLYTSYLQNRKSIEGAGFSSTFASQSKKALGADIGAMGKGVYQQAVAQGSTQAQQAQMSTNPIYQAYQKQVEGVGNVWSNVLSYLNAGGEGVDDVTYAETSGITKDGQLTAKGKAYLKYYMGQQSVNAEDTYLSGKGTLINYLKTNVKDVNRDWIKTLGEMSGVNLDALAYTDEERNAIVKGTAIDLSTIDVEMKSEEGASLLDEGRLTSMRKRSDGRFKEASGEYVYISNSEDTKENFNLISNLLNKAGKESVITASGMTLDELKKFGLMKDGQIIKTDNGFDIIVYKGEARYIDNKNNSTLLANLMTSTKHQLWNVPK